MSRHHFESGQSVFELNRGEHHDHIVCVECGKVEEFYDETIEKRQRAAAAERGFESTITRSSSTEIALGRSVPGAKSR